jgi:hypothetical protein
VFGVLSGTRHTRLPRRRSASKADRLRLPESERNYHQCWNCDYVPGTDFEAKPGQILINPRVLVAVENAVKVEPVGEFELKGIRRPLAAYNVLAATM